MKGYVLVLPEDRRELFDEHLSLHEYFVEPVMTFSHSRGSYMLVFISKEDGFITHYSLGKGGVSAGTGLRRLNLDNVTAFGKSISFTEIVSRVPRNVRRFIKSVLMNGGMIPDKSFDAFILAILDIEPSVGSLIARFNPHRAKLFSQLKPKEVYAIGQQKEAVVTAFQFADIDRKPLLEWMPKAPGESKSFLDGLSEVYAREDSMILNDFEFFPGLNRVMKPAISGTCRFQDRKTTLDIILANRTVLEEQTGADLIYYNIDYDSFVFVQYKAMEKQGLANRPAFRLPNSQFSEEISRMKQVIQRIGTPSEYLSRNEYRLTSNPFFIKLCPRIVMNPDDIGLTPGMYFTIDHWMFLEKDEDLVGPKGGRVVTYENVGRYFSNTDFASIVRGAWVGTVSAQSSYLAKLIEEILKTGKSVVFAIKRDRVLQYPDDFLNDSLENKF